MNVNLSDTMAGVWAQAYYLERFMNTRDGKYIDQASEHLNKVVEMVTALSAYIKIPERQAVANKMIAQAKEYLVLLAEIKTNMLAWQKAYDETIYPSVSKLQQMTEAIGTQATRTENLPVLSGLNEAWVCVNRISYRLTRFAEAASPENAESLAKAIEEMQPVLTGMRQIMVTELAQKDFAQFKGLYDAVSSTFNA